MRTYVILEQDRAGRLQEVGTVNADDSSKALQAGKRLTTHPITTPTPEDYRRLGIAFPR